MGIISSLVALLAAVLTLIAFALDIALFGLVDVEFNKLNADITTKTGPGSSTPFFISPTLQFDSKNCHLLFSFAFV